MKNYIFSLEKHEGRKAIVTENAKVSYEDITGLCVMLEKRLEKNSLIFIMCRNTPGCVSSYLGAINSPSLALLLPENIDRDVLSGFTAEYSPEYIALPEESEELNSSLCRKKVADVMDYVIFETGLKGKGRINDETRLLLATSGSTGDSKVVRLSRKNLETNAEQIAEYLDIREDDRPVTTLPMNYTYGLSVINSHLLKGATICLTDRSVIEMEFWDFLESSRANSIAGVPYTYQMLDRLKMFEAGPGNIRYLTQAGGRLSTRLQEKIGKWAKRNSVRFFIMYGQTEATARMSYLPSRMCLEKPGSIGIAVPGGRFELIDENGETVSEPGRTGELVYYGKNVSLGYATSRADLEKGDERGGRLETGDMARMDEDGYFYITGRKKRFIKLFGIRTGLDALEEQLSGKFTADFACTGVDDSLEIFHDGQLDNETVSDHVLELLRIPRRAVTVRHIDKIPRTDSGKTDYRKLEEMT